MRFEAIVVPQGAEARSVERGWRAPRPPLIVIPAGAAAGNRLGAVPPAQTALVLGVCGALDPALRVGDCVVYADVVDGAERIELDPQLAAGCAEICGRAPVRAATVPRVVGEASAKAALWQATGAAVVDMEAAPIARTLHGLGVRVAMVRIVSDDAHGELPDLNDIYDANGALRPIALARALARTPRRGVLFIAHALLALRVLRSTATRLSLMAID